MFTGKHTLFPFSKPGIKGKGEGKGDRLLFLISAKPLEIPNKIKQLKSSLSLFPDTIDLLGLLIYKDKIWPPKNGIIEKLKCMERELGTDLSISSGKRPESKDSEHKEGDAADISTNWGPSKSLKPCKIRKAALKCGFTRACQSLKYNHVHVDVNKTKTKDCSRWDGGDYITPCECKYKK